MAAWVDNIVYKFKKAGTIEQLIYINIIIFALTYITTSLSAIGGSSDNFIIRWFALPAQFNDFVLKPWTILSYGFLHGDFLHILFNLILLFYIGNLFLDFFNRKEFYTYYGLGIMIGGLFYLLSYGLYPTLMGANGILVGASAGVSAILIGLATKVPNYAIHFRFIGAIKLWYIAVAFVLIDLIQLPISNSGGHLAHLGGAFIGYFLTKIQVSPKQKRKPKSPLKTVYKNKEKTTTSTEQQRIDAILDKISKSGYETLSKVEKDFLFSIRKTKSDQK